MVHEEEAEEEEEEKVKPTARALRNKKLITEDKHRTQAKLATSNR